MKPPSQRPSFRRATASLLAILLIAPAIVHPPAATASALPSGFVEELVAAGLAQPTAMAFLPDGRMLVTEKRGSVRVVKNGALLATPFIDLSAEVNDYWDRGLGGLAIDPAFATNGYVYLFYPHDSDGTDGTGAVTNRLVRVTAAGDVAAPGSMTTILGSVSGAGCPSPSADCLPQEWYGHAADTVAFAPDGTLFISEGDASSWDYVDDRALRAQSIDEYPGKILHVNKDGSAVASNPFYDASNPGSIRSKVYAYGFRNPFRLTVDPANSRVYVGDVGWNTVEEIDTVVAGKNYGWPCFEGAGHTAGYDQLPGCQALYAQGAGAVTAPTISWDHDGAGAAAVAGPITPHTSAFPESYHDGMFYADYANGWIRFAPAGADGTIGGSTQPFATGTGAPVSLAFGPDGFLYYVDIGSNSIRRIRPSASTSYLSDLPTTGTPVNGWGAFERDRSNGEGGAADGRTLTIGATTYPKGIGTHAASDLRFNVPAGCTAFSAQVGIDDEVGNKGSVAFEVWDSTTTRLYQSPLRTGNDGPLTVNVDLTSVTTLRLVATNGGDNSNFDHADWADAKLTCNTASGGGDSSPPVISGIVSTPTAGSSTVSWTTDEPATSQIDYGTTTAYGTSSPLVTTLATSHSQVLTGLSPVTTYHYRLRSSDAAGNTAFSTDATFTTDASGSTFLSDLPTTGSPVNGWGPFERDRSNGEAGAADGRTLTIGATTYPKGIGTHAASDLRFNVPAGCTAFSAQIGIDDEVGNRGTSTFEVWNSTTTRLYQSPLRTGNDGPLTVNVPLSGVTTLRLVATNGGDNNNYDHANWADAKLTCTTGGGNTPPVPVISSPGTGATFKVGDVVTLTGNASDAEDGTVPGTQLAWQVITRHCPGSVCHTHFFQSYSGPTATLTFPDHGDDSFLEATLTATDDDGTSASTSVNIQPKTAQLTLASTPTGQQLLYNDQTVTAPATISAVVGGTRTISAPTPQGAATFVSWSDGGAAQHNIVVPATNTTLTATFSTSGSTGATFLSDLPTTGSPVNGWGPFERDRSNGEAGAADGRTLTIGATTYPKGIGTHAASDLRFNVPAGCTAFSAQIGIDDEVGNRGTSTFEVWNSTTTRLYQSPLRTGNDGPLAVNVPLSGVTTLRLVATNGGDNNNYDHANWADAKLTCTTGGGSGGTPTFAAPTASATGRHAHDVAIADVNGDGKLDLASANAQDNTFSVSLGTGPATFAAPTAYATGGEPKSVDLADLNSDGKLDAVTANQASNNVSVALGNGNGTFQASVNYAAAGGAHEALVVDLNADGKLDLAVAGWGGSIVSILLGNGNGTFAAKTDFSSGAAPHSVAPADFNKDGKVDLVVANHGDGTAAVLLGNGNGTFAAPVSLAAGSGPHSVRVADLNGDTNADFVVALDAANAVAVFLGNGNGTFQPKSTLTTGQTPKGVELADINGDGKIDILTANIRGNYPSLNNPGGDSVSILLGTGTGTFAPKVDVTVGQGPFSVSARDLNGDGKRDLVTANWWDAGVSILLQQ
jgi:glucose/arabinose dehydrogenase